MPRPQGFPSRRRNIRLDHVDHHQRDDRKADQEHAPPLGSGLAASPLTRANSLKPRPIHLGRSSRISAQVRRRLLDRHRAARNRDPALSTPAVGETCFDGVLAHCPPAIGCLVDIRPNLRRSADRGFLEHDADGRVNATDRPASDPDHEFHRVGRASSIIEPMRFLGPSSSSDPARHTPNDAHRDPTRQPSRPRFGAVRFTATKPKQAHRPSTMTQLVGGEGDCFRLLSLGGQERNRSGWSDRLQLAHSPPAELFRPVPRGPLALIGALSSRRVCTPAGFEADRLCRSTGQIDPFDRNSTARKIQARNQWFGGNRHSRYTPYCAATNGFEDAAGRCNPTVENRSA